MTIEHCRALGLDLVPGTGLLAPCVPGTFDSYMLLLRDYGTMPLRSVLEPAIHYARHGYPLIERIVATIKTVETMFREHWTTSADLYLPGGALPVVGSRFRNTAMADTYERLLKEAEAGGGSREAVIERARKVWSQGFIAEAIDRFCRTQEVMDVSGKRNRGVLTGDDMARWQASVEKPAEYNYGRYTVQKPAPGARALPRCSSWPCSRGSIWMGWIRPGRISFISRWKPPSWPLPTVTHSSVTRSCDGPAGNPPSDTYNAQRRALISDRASHEQRPGTIPGFGGAMAVKAVSGKREAVSAGGAGEPTVGDIHTGHGAGEVVEPNGITRGDTVHFDIIDRHGNMIAATPSGGWLQSSPIIPELGFCLGSRAQMFMLDESHPAALAPGRRPRTTLSPTMALRDGKPYLAWGSPGGDQQDQWIPQMFPAPCPCRDEPAGGDRRAGLAYRTFPDVILAAHGTAGRDRGGIPVSKETIAELERRGHIVEVGPAWSEGRLVAASQDGEFLRAAANPRGMQGYAAGR